MDHGRWVAVPNKVPVNFCPSQNFLFLQKPKFPKQKYNARSTIDNKNREYEEQKKGISQDDVAMNRRRKPSDERDEEAESRRRRKSAERRLQKKGDARDQKDDLWYEDLTDGRKSGAKFNRNA